MKRPSSLSSVWLNTYSVFLPRILQTERAFSRPTPDRSTNFMRDYAEVVKSGDVFVSVVHWGKIFLPRPAEIFISTMQMSDLHRRLAQLSSQTSHKTARRQTRGDERRVVPERTFIHMWRLTRRACGVTAQQLSVSDRHTFSHNENRLSACYLKDDLLLNEVLKLLGNVVEVKKC